MCYRDRGKHFDIRLANKMLQIRCMQGSLWSVWSLHRTWILYGFLCLPYVHYKISYSPFEHRTRLRIVSDRYGSESRADSFWSAKETEAHRSRNKLFENLENLFGKRRTENADSALRGIIHYRPEHICAAKIVWKSVVPEAIQRWLFQRRSVTAREGT